MTQQDNLVEIIETTNISIETPASYTIEAVEQSAMNQIELVVTSVPVSINAEAGFSSKLELMDGNLFITTNDGLLGTRVRQITNILIADSTVFQIPVSATKLFIFSLNGIDYIENVVLNLGTGTVTFTAGLDGYTPRKNDFLSIIYSE